VEQASNSVSQTAAFARRAVCRTLTVLGGVAAGTALAWWLSTGAASADAAPLAQQDPVAQVQDLVAPVTGPVEQVVHTVVDTVEDPVAPARDPLTDLGDTVADLRDHAEQGLANLPDCTTAVCLDAEQPGHEYQPDGFGRAESPLRPQASAPAAVTEATSVEPDAVADRTATARAFSDGMNRRGSPAPVQPAAPDLPTWPTPYAPALPTVPATGNNSQAGNPADSHLFATLPWRDDTVGLSAGGFSATTRSVTVDRPGTQPGVAPD
jgi:hypothetical protein